MNRLLYKAFLIASGLFILIAAPALAYAFRAPVTLSNTSATSYSMFPYIWNQNNSYLASNGFMGSTGLDSRVETLSGTAKPHLLTTNMTLTAAPSNAGSQTNLYFTTGSSNLTAFDILTGYGGYVTIADSANQELASNFTKTYTNLYLSGDGNIDVKPDAYAFTRSSTNVTFEIAGMTMNSIYYPSVASSSSGANTGSTVNMSMPSGTTVGDLLIAFLDGYAVDASAGTYTAPNGWTNLFNTSFGATSRFAAWYHSVNGTESNPTTWTISEDTYWSYRILRIVNASLIAPSVGVTATGAASQPDPPSLTSGFSSNMTLYIASTGSYLAATAAPANYSGLLSLGSSSGFVSVATRQLSAVSDDPGVFTTGGTTWAANTIAVKGRGGVVVSGIADGLYSTATVHSDSTNLWATVGSSASTNVTTAAVPNNANNIVLMSNATPYLGSYTLAVGGNQQVYYAPNAMIVGTALPDRGTDATDNAGVITWGTNTTNLTATVGSLVSTTQTTETATATDPPPDYIPPARAANLGSGLEPTVPAALQTSIFRPLVTMVSDTTTLNEMQVWRWYGLMFVLIIAGAVLVKLKGHLGISAIAAGVAIAVVVVLSVWPWYALVLAVLCFLGGIMLERTPSY